MKVNNWGKALGAATTKVREELFRRKRQPEKDEQPEWGQERAKGRNEPLTEKPGLLGLFPAGEDTALPTKKDRHTKQNIPPGGTEPRGSWYQTPV